MATFGEFQTDVADIVAQSNLSGSMVLLTRLAQDQLSRKYAPRFLEHTVSITPSVNQFILPADMLRFFQARLWDTSGGSAQLTEVPESYGRRVGVTRTTAITSAASISEPFFWREVGGLCLLSFDITTGMTVEVDYKRKEAYLAATTDTNLWLENAYDILLYATAMHAMVYMKDETSASM